MRVSEHWLRTWINPEGDVHDLAHQLTMAGLEVDSITPVAGDFTQVVVGHVREVSPHPDAKRLNVCEVDIAASELLTIVCGGVNVRPGIKVAVACVGAQLPGGLTIESVNLRGVSSSGMICSAKELGLTGFVELPKHILELADDAPIGESLRTYLNLNDHEIKIDLTPNRGDCLSVLGLARELSAIHGGLSYQTPKLTPVVPTIDHVCDVVLEAKTACPRYCGRVIQGLPLKAVTPVWLAERLRRVGVRLVHPVVDICNYVMFELGQPLHSFNLDSLTGPITARFAQADESITLIDHQTVTLHPETLVIADQIQPRAIAGVMGSACSEVNENTTTVFLESAWFNPVALVKASRRYHLPSEAAYRFERHVDPTGQRVALERATALIIEHLGGAAGPITEQVVSDHLPQSPQILLSQEHVQTVLGIELDSKTVQTSLTHLGMTVTSATSTEDMSSKTSWKVTPPPYRSDLQYSEDLIEEVARLYGYDRIEPQPITASISPAAPIRSNALSEARIRQSCVLRGYHEIITYPFIDPELQAQFDPGVATLTLSNPLASAMSVMRTRLWPSLLSTARYNLRRQMHRIRLFEIGLTYIPQSDGVAQRRQLAGLAMGPVFPEQWGLPSRSVDFFDVKGDIMALLQQTGQAEALTWTDQVIRPEALHPGRSAALMQGEACVGYLGQLHPALAQTLSLSEPCFLFSIDMTALTHYRRPTYRPLAKYPSVRRDLALVVDCSLSLGKLLPFIRQTVGEQLVDCVIFDVYMGKGIENDKKSIAIGLTFQDPSRTLVDNEIDTCMQHLISELDREFKASLRA